MIASLMMYQRPELVDAHKRFWVLIRKHLAALDVDSPKELSQEAEEFSVWNSPDLVLSQTCGMPYRTWLHDNVQLVGTPDYGLENCPAGYYRSAIVVRADDKRTDVALYRDAVFAYNQTFSQSGYAAPYWHLRPCGFWFQNRLQSNQHVGSARFVADGRADIAAIDAVTWRNVMKYEPFADQLRVLDWTAPTPGLPLITSARIDATKVYDAISTAVSQLDRGDQSALGIKGVVKIAKEKYLRVPNPPAA
ncbi:MAG: PhnD/SsuA/transferrin family substrate-binding protein [Yoonia sp.]|jgi:ABC-type phosphate/phosphonate transport system substrate-binding protein|nr:PhnD/SsuA/transferrin family substrate-binding protein [Yoonia sp.]